MRIRRRVLDEIVAHARADAPLECCGLLLGSADLVDESWPAANLRSSTSRFEIDPAGHFAAIRTARATNRAVIGAYHSHPSSAAVPSDTDVREAHDRELFHLIVSLSGAEPDARLYRIADGTVEPVPVEVEE